MITSVLLYRAVFAIAVAAFVSGCVNTAPQSTAAPLDCDDRYTRCAVQSEQGSKGKALTIPQQNTSSSDDVSVPAIVPPSITPVLFDFDSAKTTHLELSEAVAFLIMYPEARLTLHGFTDPVGREDYNRALSYQRAAYVRERLLMVGVSSSQISLKAHGENDFIVAELAADQILSRDDLIEQYAPNRRVEFAFTHPDTMAQAY
ncbi:OmpA family protein [Marinomonas sp. M1K-6]|uniref:OmpA family protein n=1 Tax=Marinomonas profundi TaxID=2726122 RepID=A0A847R276_9GAMM|nr:OmpA family protein [Marinomonas profundi]NLQ17931.1 OmpA family protein [Marinomonas profundi]UDV03415.1 OmpA family protein [Marinomonas profundi]